METCSFNSSFIKWTKTTCVLTDFNYTVITEINFTDRTHVLFQTIVIVCIRGKQNILCWTRRVHFRNFTLQHPVLQKVPYTCTRWFKYDRDWLCVNKSQFVPVIFKPPCSYRRINWEIDAIKSVLNPKRGYNVTNTLGHVGFLPVLN